MAAEPSGYLTQIGTAGLFLAPTVQTRRWRPADKPAGMTTFNCTTPATMPGAAPAYRTWAGKPSMVTETGAAARA